MFRAFRELGTWGFWEVGTLRGRAEHSTLLPQASSEYPAYVLFVMLFTRSWFKYFPGFCELLK